MSHLEHRAGVKEVNLVVKQLKLEGANETNRDAIIEAIDHLWTNHAVFMLNHS